MTIAMNSSSLTALVEATVALFVQVYPEDLPEPLQLLGSHAFLALEEMEEQRQRVRGQLRRNPGHAVEIDLPMHDFLYAQGRFLLALAEWGGMTPDALSAASKLTDLCGQMALAIGPGVLSGSDQASDAADSAT